MGKGCQTPNALKPDLYLTSVAERLERVIGAAEAAPIEASMDVLWISATAGNAIGGQPPFSGS